MPASGSGFGRSPGPRYDSGTCGVLRPDHDGFTGELILTELIKRAAVLAAYPLGRAAFFVGEGADVVAAGTADAFAAVSARAADVLAGTARPIETTALEADVRWRAAGEVVWRADGIGAGATRAVAASPAGAADLILRRTGRPGAARSTAATGATVRNQCRRSAGAIAALLARDAAAGSAAAGWHAARTEAGAVDAAAATAACPARSAAPIIAAVPASARRGTGRWRLNGVPGVVLSGLLDARSLLLHRLAPAFLQRIVGHDVNCSWRIEAEDRAGQHAQNRAARSRLRKRPG
jgi:hypothetical protein